jgi:hypothetical protein
MKAINWLRNLSLTRKAFVIWIVVLREIGMLWRLSLLDVARFLEENLENEMAWTVMIWYLKSLAVIYNGAFVLAFILRCRNVGMPVFYGFFIPCFAFYLSIHFRDMTPLFVIMFMMTYLTFKSGPSDINLWDYIFEDK